MKRFTHVTENASFDIIKHSFLYTMAGWLWSIGSQLGKLLPVYTYIQEAVAK